MGKRISTLFLIFFVISINNCSNKKNSEQISTNIEKRIKSLPDSEIYDFVYKYTSNGRLKWELFSEKAEIFKKQNIIKVNGVHLSFYNAKGEVDTGLDAKYGVVDNNKKIMTAVSNVVLRTAGGSVLYTDILNWDDNSQKLFTDSKVKIIRENGDIIKGTGLEADNRLEKIIIKHRVRGKIYENN